MEKTVQGQFVATGNTFIEHPTKLRVIVEGVISMKIRHHQPGHRHIAECIDGFDERLIISPRRRCYIVQHQQ
jgi:hypothetical protein